MEIQGDKIIKRDLYLDAETASRIAHIDASKRVKGLDTTTYPSLTEIAHIKGVTSAVQTQLNAKEPTIAAGTTGQYYRGDKSWQTLDKTAVGLGNVDNIQQIPLTEKAAALGVATLDAAGKIPIGQLPALPTIDVFTVASQAAMLALSADQGDMAIRTDVSKTFVLSTNSPSTLADWIELSTPATPQYGYVRFTVGDGVSVITAGTTNFKPQIPYAGTITGWYVSETTSPNAIAGSIVIDVWKDTSGNYPPTVADTIAGTEKPTLSSAKLNSDLTLTTWTTSVSVGDCIGFTVVSNTDCKRVEVLLSILKS